MKTRLLIFAALAVILTGCCSLGQRISIARSELAARIMPAQQPAVK